MSILCIHSKVLFGCDDFVRSFFAVGDGIADVLFACAYGLTRDELRYILEPAHVHGPEFPGETFRVLKEKEQVKDDEYRTRPLVLEAWDKLEHAVSVRRGRRMGISRQRRNSAPALGSHERSM